MAGSESGPVFMKCFLYSDWLPERTRWAAALYRKKKTLCLLYHKSFNDQAHSLKMDE